MMIKEEEEEYNNKTNDMTMHGVEIPFRSSKKTSFPNSDLLSTEEKNHCDRKVIREGWCCVNHRRIDWLVPSKFALLFQKADLEKQHYQLFLQRVATFSICLKYHEFSCLDE